jgi:hypothetical protein
MNVGGPNADTYFDRVLAYIPADIVAVWAFISETVASATAGPTGIVLWIVFVIATILAGVWTWRQTSEPGKGVAVTQIAIATIAFVVWVFAIGGPFKQLAWYQPWIGTTALALYTLIAGAIVPQE